MAGWDVDIEEPRYGTGTGTYQIKIDHPLTCVPVMVDGVPKVIKSGSQYTFYYVDGTTDAGIDQWDSGVVIGTPTTFDISCVLNGKKPPVHKEKVDVAGGGGGGPRPGYVGSFRRTRKKFILVPSRASK
jgi:hypothetical protein